MKNIFLKALTLTNFKGIRSFTANFSQATNIFGANEAGKTTLFDGFLWLFFGKDSTDRKDFEIKTLDENNKPYRKLDHEVTGVIVVEGEEITIRRCLREKWTTKRGQTEQEFTGHETTYFWNDVPMKQEEYQAKIASLLNENIFKLITNTTYFNSMKWQDRRAVLLTIAGDISDDEIIKTLTGPMSVAGKFDALIRAFSQKKTVEEFRKEVQVKRKKLKDELALLPSRIDEASRSLPEEKNYDAIEAMINEVTGDISNIDEMLQSKSRAEQDRQSYITDLIRQQQELVRKMLFKESEIKTTLMQGKLTRQNNIQQQKSELQQLNNELSSTRNDYSKANARKTDLLKEQEALRDQWNKIDAEKLVFNENEFRCPACKRDFEAADIDSKKQTITENFNTDKAKRLQNISERGKAIGIEIADLETKLSNLVAKGEELNNNISVAQSRITELETENERLSNNEAAEILKAIESDQEYQALKKQHDDLYERINAPYSAEDNSALKLRKQELNGQLDQLKKDAATKDQREKQLKRIDELKEQESAMSQELASLDGIEFSIEEFTKAKMDLLETRINGRFKIVRFKMFETQINGGQVEACTTLINGVPYSDANTAAKIQAGLDIINTLSDHYGVKAPVWVDNRESVTMLPDTSCQLISLFVSPKDKKLRIGGPAA